MREPKLCQTCGAFVEGPQYDYCYNCWKAQDPRFSSEKSSFKEPSSTMKWYLHYTESCTPKLMQFNTREELEKFMLVFLLESQGNEDNWVNMVFHGFLHYNDYELE